MSAQDDLIPEENRVPRCVACPHPALDHEYDGWGFDRDGASFDWFKCFDSTCHCRVKGFIHPRNPINAAQPQESTVALSTPTEALPQAVVAVPQGLPANWDFMGYPYGV